MPKDKGASRSEKPTPKRLRDARREGQVHKSQELTSTVLILFWLIAAWLTLPRVTDLLSGLFETALVGMSQPFELALATVGTVAIKSLLWVVVPGLLLACLVAALTEFLQVGPVFAPKRVVPKAEHVNPAEGLKRMFSLRNLVEVVKAVVKTALLLAIVIVVTRDLMPQVMQLPTEEPAAVTALIWKGTWVAGAWTIFVFFFVAVLDAVYQRAMFVRELRMSRRDIRQEHKETEGDPHIKQSRRELHQQWATHNILHAVRKSNVVVTNPTHVAVALLYDPDETDLPVVTAKGEDQLAREIRAAAEEAGVPIMRNVELARGLNRDVEAEHYITGPYFDAVAQVLQWAAAVSEERLK